MRTESGKGTVLYREYFGLQLRNQLQEVEDCPHKVLAVISITIIIINIRNNKNECWSKWRY